MLYLNEIIKSHDNILNTKIFCSAHNAKKIVEPIGGSLVFKLVPPCILQQLE